MLSDLYDHAPDDDKAQTGFLARDILRFIAVDIILIVLVKLFLGMGFFTGPGEYVAGILVGKLVLLAYLIWLIRDRRHAWPATGIATGGRWQGWLIAIGLYAAYYYALPFINTINWQVMTLLYHWLGWRYEALPQDVMILIFENILQQPIRLKLVGFTVLIGPVMEELAFRGMGYDAYNRIRGAAFAVIWTGLLFGVYHFRLDLIIPLGLIGVVFGIARAVSRSLWCPILLHCFHNCLALWVMAKELSRL